MLTTVGKNCTVSAQSTQPLSNSDSYPRENSADVVIMSTQNPQ
uniref:Uncharacterized protein n=1 Tax=Anguilla anguilla TaxID=7936 RepID=A0A0E9Q944_ANGAN